jgi:hypothetical protein
MKVIYYVQAPCCAFPLMLTAGAPARNFFSSHVSQTGSISEKGSVLPCSLSCNIIWKQIHFSPKGKFRDI